MNKIRLDMKNQKLLNLLEKNSRAPLSKIAKELNTSKEVVHYRLKQLLKLGFIKRFYLLADYFSLDYKYFRLIINLHNLKYHIRKTIIEELRSIENIDLNVYLLSNWDLEINIWLKHTEEFFDFYNTFIEKYAEYIMDKNLYVITKIYYFSHAYLHKHRHSIILGDEKNKKIDLIDEKIIELLEKNPREEIIKIAEELKISPSTANFRLKKLYKKNLIKGCIPILNKSLIGYNSYRIEIILNNPAKKKEIINYLSAKYNVIKIAELIGRRDLDFEVDFRTTAELDAFLEELRLNVPNIKDFEVINILMD